MFSALVLLVLAACVPMTPAPTALNGPLPPLAPGMARLVFYRIADPYGATQMAPVSLNGQSTGISQLGGMFYRDVVPGPYAVTVASQRAYPDQFKTVAPHAGETFYLRLSTLPRLPCRVIAGAECTDDAFTVEVVDPAVAARELQGLQLTSG
jgi:hypothetical protein